MQKILLLDNYDSFTYNLRQLLAECGVPHSLHIAYNDAITIEEAGKFDKILLSPGAGLPHEAGMMPQLIATYAGKKSILGVCLGHQAIAEHFGAQLYNLPTPQHGQRVPLQICERKNPLFKHIRQGTKVGLYHSWAVERETLQNFSVLAEARGLVMAMQHKTLPVWGVQFHPESMMTQAGAQMMRNWLLEA